MTESFTTPTRSNSIFYMNEELIQIRKQITTAITQNKDFINVDCPKNNSESVKKQLRSEGYEIIENCFCFKMKWKISWC